MTHTGEKTHKSALAVVPPEEIWAPIQAIREAHDRQHRRWMPHINLLYPFWPRQHFERAERELLPVCEGSLPFEIALARVEFFHHGHGNYTLWLAPEPSEVLRDLQGALAERLPDLQPPRGQGEGYVPHLTLGQIKGREDMERLRGALQASWQPIAFIAKELCLLWRDEPPEDVFRIDRRLRLGSR